MRYYLAPNERVYLLSGPAVGKGTSWRLSTAFGKPLIFHFTKGDCILRKEIADNEILDTYSYIKQNL